MGKIYETIDSKLREWLSAQKIFFVATAPLSPEGHVNCSPKDGESFRVIDEQTVVYLDLTGSGVETVAHVKENERIVLMFCAFDGAPKIVRLHGHGKVIETKHPEFEQLRAIFRPVVGIRSFIRVHLTRISDSCGYGVPLYHFRGHRSQLEAWAEHKGEESLLDYRVKHNSQSVDQLEGISHKSRNREGDKPQITQISQIRRG
jgi:Pyridoxamine 5'-phosphate oxidase